MGPGVPRPGCLTVTQEAQRMLSCNSGLGQKMYNGHWFENPICVIFLQKVTCIKPRLLTWKPKGHRKLRRPRTCRWRCLWTRWVASIARQCRRLLASALSAPVCLLASHPQPLPKLSQASGMFWVPSSWLLLILQILCHTFPVCPSLPHMLFCYQDPS